jgi:uncharacterized protein YbbK (DUF523 family)/uncharacterized protein YbgA (DUF1722 family)
MNQPHTSINLAISSCLTGIRVRYDGDHKKDDYITGTLANYFNLIPICPEVGIGLGIPRKPIHLVKSASRLRVLSVEDNPPSIDATLQLIDYARQKSQQLGQISGYIFKSRSPSCGVWDVPVSDQQGRVTEYGAGMFAREWLRLNPLLPVIDEVKLNDPVQREHFFERVFAFSRCKALNNTNTTFDALNTFHRAHYYCILSHGQDAWKTLDDLVTRARTEPMEELIEDYQYQFMQALQHPATHAGHIAVLEEIFARIKKHISAVDVATLEQQIDLYRQRQTNLAEVLPLFRNVIQRSTTPELNDQTYLSLSGEELELRFNSFT